MFLPATGYDDGGGVNMSEGMYWSSSSAGEGKSFRMSHSRGACGVFELNRRYRRHSIRLASVVSGFAVFVPACCGVSNWRFNQ